MKKRGALLITACACLVAISNSLTSPSFGIGEFSVIDSYIEVQENLPEIMSQTVESTINSEQDSLTLPINNGEELVLSTEESPTIQMQDKIGMPIVEISLDTSIEFSTGLEAGALSADGVGFGVVLQPLDDSARLITVSAEASKASSVKFDLNVSDGHFVTMNGEGAILVVQAESQSDADAGKGIAIAKIPAPWAFDGNGFSQGAWVLGHSLSRIGQSWWTEGGTSQDLVAAVLLSDPGHDNPNDNGALRIYDPSGSNGGGSGIGQIIDIPSLMIDDARNWKYPIAQKSRVLSVCVDTDLVCAPNWFDLGISPLIAFPSALGIHSGWRYGSNGVAPSFAINWVNERRWN